MYIIKKTYVLLSCSPIKYTRTLDVLKSPTTGSKYGLKCETQKIASKPQSKFNDCRLI